jgi:acyl-CoA reductase-like NAD-dependent aldehyde dehydrogenase
MASPSRPAIQYTKLFINNEWRDAVAGGSFETLDPSTGKPIASVAEALAADVDVAVNAAAAAFAPGS